MVRVYKRQTKLMALGFYFVVLLAMTIYPFSLGVNMLIKDLDLKNRGVEIVAEIYEKGAYEDSSSDNQINYVFKYEYKNEDGDLYRSRAFVSLAKFNSLEVGDTLIVVYDPQNPTNVKEVGSNIQSVGGYILVGFSLLSGVFISFLIYKTSQIKG